MTVTVHDVTALDRSRFHYRCTHDHLITNAPAPLDACPAWVKGQPCDGSLERFGPGSRG